MRKANLKILLIITLISLSQHIFSQNPISPPGVYLADPAAHVWNDGRLHVYGSVDQSLDHYCSHTYHPFSTDDMENWTLHTNIFSSKDEDDQVDYNDELLYAPDCQYKNGTYFLYYCQPDQQHTAGVLFSS